MNAQSNRLQREESVSMTPTHSKKRLFLCSSAWLGVLVWMGIIFGLSAQQSSESAALSGQFLAFLNKVFSAELSGFLVRKGAHVTEYFILAVLIFIAVSLTRQKPGPFLAFFITLLVATGDEFHQYFVPGRACQLKDVLIDSAGAVVGILLCVAAVAVYRQLKKRKNRKP